ncbi:RNA-directed DNA polymerase, eukaryota [Tanacetum coccineum]
MGDHNWKLFNSKEDQTGKISKSIFVTNFLDHICARDLWNVCNDYGSVVDIYIPSKRSKAGKRFAFIRFIKVFKLERLIENLCTIWMGSFRLHVNKVLYEREQKPRAHSNDKRPGVFRAHFPTAANSGNNRDTFASIIKEGTLNHSFTDQTKPALVIDDSCTKERDFSMSLIGKVKEVYAIPNLYIILSKEGFQTVKLTYLGGLWVLIELDSLDSIEKFCNHVGVGSWFSMIKSACNSFVSNERIVWVSLEGLRSKHGLLILSQKLHRSGGKVYWIRAKELDAWVPKFHNDNYSSDDESSESDEGCLTYPPCFTPASENLNNDEDSDSVKDSTKDQVKSIPTKKRFTCLWGNYSFDHVVSPSVGTSRGTWAPSSTKLLVISVYAPQELPKKRELWGYICTLIDRWDGETVIQGLIDLPLGGYSYTWSHKSASKMSKLDHFLISKGLMALFPHLSVIADSNGLSRMKKKIQLLKDDIKTWIKENKKKINEAKSSIQCKLIEVDKSIDQGEGNKDILNQHASKRSLLSIYGILLDGDWIVDSNKVKSKFFKNFSNQFSKPLSPRVKIDFQFPTRLMLNLNKLKSWNVLFPMKRSKRWFGIVAQTNPRDLMGTLLCFFLNYWNVVNQDLVAAVYEFFSSGKFPQGCNSSFIALILKIHDAKDVKDFQPSSLIGCLYKIIAKILDNRLSLFMSDLISDVQTAFVSNRQILDVPFILNELLSWCKHKKVNAMIFMVDFKKAFDSVRWDYLDNVLKSFGFGDKWRSWIFGCLDSAMGLVLINGSPTSEFQFHKGLKQGDPLSPFLFILVMESLHISFTKVLEAGLYKGISINNSLTISHLFYADDVVFVENIDLAANIVGCSTCSPSFNYLRIKVGSSMSILYSWKEITAKISSRLSKWKLKTLSIGGRYTLLKSVLTDIPIYYMSLFKVPAGILKEMESTRRNFLNGVERSKKKLFITQGSSLWSRFIKAIHGVKGIDLIALIKRKLRNEENTLYWEDIWLGETSLKTKYPRLFALELCKGISVAAKMGHSSLFHSFRRLPRGGVEDEQYKNLCSITSEILLPNMLDQWAWYLNASGEFLVSLVRIFIDNALLLKLDVPTRWIKLEPIKINILAWKFNLDGLPTRLNLSSRGVEIPSILCHLCNEVVESTSYIFFSCSLARQVMIKVCRWWELEYTSMNSYTEWLSWFSNIRLSKLKKEILEGICYVTWWLIWRLRNQCLFGSTQPRRHLIFDNIVQMSFLWISNRCKSKIDWVIGCRILIVFLCNLF